MIDFPVQITIDRDLLYALDCLGGAVIFTLAWWVFCFIARNGIDGAKHIARMVRERKPLGVWKALTGGWKPLGETEPIRPVTSTLWDTWRSMD